MLDDISLFASGVRRVADAGDVAWTGQAGIGTRLKNALSASQRGSGWFVARVASWSAGTASSYGRSLRAPNMRCMWQACG
mmetsp:Transcript_34375/g.55019  ORF Transcript_34375/g.55019 Transcript_34375/m.55019 type:complete len:80 (-) Transcript_34375:1015-1254(-)